MASSGVRMDHIAKVLGCTIGMAKQADVWIRKDIAMGLLQLNGVTILVVNVCLTSGIGLTAENVVKLAFLTRLVNTFNVPFIMVGDWNMNPEELNKTGWLDKVNGRVMGPPAAIICTAGRGNLLDYAVVDLNAASMITSIEVDNAAVWKPHIGYTVWSRRA
jgi:hypothetical protein